MIVQLVPVLIILHWDRPDGWIALANEGQENLIGYAPANAVVKSELYDKTVREQSKRPKARKKATCVSVDGNTKACKTAITVRILD